MRATLGEWPEKLQPTVRKHSSEPLLKREEKILPSGSQKLVPGPAAAAAAAAAAFGSCEMQIIAPTPGTLQLGPAKPCVQQVLQAGLRHTRV